MIMRSQNVRRRNCGLNLIVALTTTLSLAFCTAALAPDGASPTTTDSAFVNPALKAPSSPGTRNWFGVSKPAAANSATSTTSRPVSPRSPAATKRSRWVPGRVTSSSVAARAASSGSGMAMDAGAPPPRIIIAGAPASGKGTQCNMIKERYGVVHLSTGTYEILDES